MGIFCLGFSKTIWLDYNDFFYGKFYFLDSLNVTLSSFLIFIGAIIFQLQKKKQNSEILIQTKYLILSLIVILILILKQDPNLFNFSALILFLFCCQQFSKKQVKAITFTLVTTVLLQIGIATFQALSQNSTNLALFKYLGEPTLSLESKGISKINIFDQTFFRPYGTLNHPNLLAGLIFTTLLLSQKISSKLKFLYYFGILLTLSISSSLSTIIYTFKKKSKYIYIIISIVVIIALFKIYDPNYKGLIDRLIQLQSLYNWNPNLIELLIGSEQKLLNYQNSKILPWENQPVHNHYIYALINYGLFGLSLTAYCSYKLFKKHSLIFISLLPILLLDHYFLTHANGILLLGLIYLSISKKIGVAS